MAQCCASRIKNIIIAQCRVSGINVGTHHALIWLDAGASTAQKCASGINMVYCCVSGIKMAQHGSMLCIMHQYGSVLCIHSSMMCIRHQYGTILLNAVQALIYGPMLCIKHHNMAQPVHHDSIWLDVVHPLLKLCIIHHYGSIQHDSSH